MVRFEEIAKDMLLIGVIPGTHVQVIDVTLIGSTSARIVYSRPDGVVSNTILYRMDEQRLEKVDSGLPWTFKGDGYGFRLAAEALRIKLAHLFDPVLAVHTSNVEPLPHQITAVYEAMLPRMPLRFLLADDPGAGKTIMAGLLIKELMVRGDLRRCLVLCPGSLLEQWQDELNTRFDLHFDILTNDGLESARTGNWFAEHDLAIASVDKVKLDERAQEMLKDPECMYDLIICDEAHKMSASFISDEIKYTKRYQLGQLVSGLTRHFLLMTATPHNGKDEDFQLFMALLDGDRFAGRFRDGVHSVDVSDMMRRMQKEDLLRFDGKPLFQERIARTLPYALSDLEAALYAQVTEYVRDEFNRADRLSGRRKGTVGFALTILQRRLASSPEAIFQSLVRRRKRLEERLAEEQLLQRGRTLQFGPEFDEEGLDDLEDDPDTVDSDHEVLDEATASRTIEELRAEISTLKALESLASSVRASGTDTKWVELSGLLQHIFSSGSHESFIGDPELPYLGRKIPKPVPSPRQKLVIFTEHRDTLNYLHRRITTLNGRPQSVVLIHGGMGRDERKRAQEQFLHQPDVQVLLATDAAGEGINLQRAHLMVNYDLPWNPNRLEQRFGRIHRIGQTEVCHLWNLVANDTREGEVYNRLLLKLEEARTALGGKVFDVLGKLQFDGQTLRELLVEAIRYGESPEVQARLKRAIENGVDKPHLASLIEERALANSVMDVTRVSEIREDMERANARKLQPHYIESFFRYAFEKKGGAIRNREDGRFEVTNVPAVFRERSRQLGRGAPVLPKYERITFEKSKITVPGKPLAAFVCPGHPLLDAVLSVTFDELNLLMRQGTVLVDEKDESDQPRLMIIMDHMIRDGTMLSNGENRVISKQLLYLEMTKSGDVSQPRYAPYLDYRPLRDDEPTPEEIRSHENCTWMSAGLEECALNYAIEHVVPQHLEEIVTRRHAWVEKTRVAVKERLEREISYWDSRYAELKIAEQAGRPAARLNSGEALRRARNLEERLESRLMELEMEAGVFPNSPTVLGAVLVVPKGLLTIMQSDHSAPVSPSTIRNTQESAAKARAIVMDIERSLGHAPIDREFEKVGYDIESKDGVTGRLRLIEVKGRVEGADVITVTKNEILHALNSEDNYYLVIVEFISDGASRTHYIRNPFANSGLTQDFNGTTVNFPMQDLINKAFKVYS